MTRSSCSNFFQCGVDTTEKYAVKVRTSEVTDHAWRSEVTDHAWRSEVTDHAWRSEVTDQEMIGFCMGYNSYRT